MIELLINKIVYIDMDGVLTKYSYDDYKDNLWLKHPEVLTNKRPIVKYLPPDWIILTRYSTEKERELKREWIQHYFPNNGFILSPIEKHHMVSPQNAILLDDYNKNLEDWKNAGGISIKILNDINSPRRDMLSLRIKTLKDYFSLITEDGDTYFSYRKEDE